MKRVKTQSRPHFVKLAQQAPEYVLLTAFLTFVLILTDSLYQATLMGKQADHSLEILVFPMAVRNCRAQRLPISTQPITFLLGHQGGSPRMETANQLGAVYIHEHGSEGYMARHAMAKCQLLGQQSRMGFAKTGNPSVACMPT